QDRGDPPPWPVARNRRRRVRDPHLGRLVQWQSSARVARLRPTRRVRAGVPQPSAENRRDGSTHAMSSPETPARFRPTRPLCPTPTIARSWMLICLMVLLLLPKTKTSLFGSLYGDTVVPVPATAFPPGPSPKISRPLSTTHPPNGAT